MGIFGGQSRKPEVVEPVVVEAEPVEAAEEAVELPEPRKRTVIAEEISLSGDLHGNGEVEIEGVVEGEIRVSGSVTVSATGSVKGPIEADVVRIAGRVDGNVIACEHLRLEKTGIINGDVVCVSFVLEDGGRLNGRATMTGEQ